MTSKAHNFSTLKHQLLEKKQHGVKTVLWKLSEEQNRYVVRTLNFVSKPEIYVIRTKQIMTHGDWSNIVRDVNYAYRRKTYKLYRRLNTTELKELEKHDVEVLPFKYRVYLQSWRLCNSLELHQPLHMIKGGRLAATFNIILQYNVP